MAAAFGASFGASAIASIFDDLAAAFKTVFNNIYRFTKPGWVITFAAGAPIALKYIDDGIEIAEKVIGDWTDALWTTAGNVYSDVYNWVCNQLGGCGGFNIFQTAAATMAAGIASGPIWLAAVIMKYVIQPMVKRILGILKQIFLAIYKFVCNVLVPIVKTAITAYVSYVAVKGVYRHMGDTVASWFSSWEPKEMFKAIGKTIGVFSAPLASGFLASYLYKRILDFTGACAAEVVLEPITPPPVSPTGQVATISKGVTVFEELYGSVLPEGVSPTLFTYTVPVTESLSASIIGAGKYTREVVITETLSASIIGPQQLPYQVNITEELLASIIKAKSLPYELRITEELSAIIEGRKPLLHEITITEELSASIINMSKREYGVNITETLGGSIFVLLTDKTKIIVSSRESYSNLPSPRVLTTIRESYSNVPGAKVPIAVRELYGNVPGPEILITSNERYDFMPPTKFLVTTRESYSIEAQQS